MRRAFSDLLKSAIAPCSASFSHDPALSLRRAHRGAILPASARYDHGELDDLAPGFRLTENWRDLPTASFAEAGTNVPTVLFDIIPLPYVTVSGI